METKAAHTPGPWHTSQSPHDRALGSSLWHILDSTFTSTGHGIGEANARLIAAAPDLLSACKNMVQAFQDGRGSPPDYLRAAIAKAEGR